ncbi:cytochrome b5 reductase family protein [Aspergillus affinis]|uniref:cytochrome b5 reductase family protein n=1 Tax=Aspergillus affinis TaxID=1070780 RepID=UPI0022FE0EE1|nr:uncharacterized protein KD926_007582 [Aspergillus affinis]KAI9040908.1 hypothetical protein KD926_007582 [Aspergillus affinis]
MKSRLSNPTLFSLRPPCLPVNSLRRPHCRRYGASAPPSSPPPRRRWMRLALVSITAAGIGAYIRSQQNSGSTMLNPERFTPYYLTSREPVSSTGSVFTLKPSKPDEGNRAVYDEAWRTGVWSVMFKQPQLQIGRDYTPLPSVSIGTEDEDELRFFIRRDPFGEVSRYLHSLDVGTPIEIRGPKIECPVPADTQQVLFIAGGTGIAPALQAGYTLLRRTSSTHKPRIHILWANRRREDCAGGVNDTTIAKPQRSWFSGSPLSSTSTPAPPPTHVSPMVRELEALKTQYPGQVTVDYYVDDENAFIEKNAILEFTKSGSSSSGSPPRNMILVSGPERFIGYMAGPKLWAQGMELQGPLTGIIRELDLKDWAVWKL